MAIKKIKKIDTPIDQRETFVSIQKSFADSDVNAQEKLKTLYALQQADTAIDRILQLRGELPGEVEALEEEISALKAKADLEDLKETIAVREEDLRLKKEELGSIVESTAKEEADLRAAREACAAKIDARTMSAYEHIRASVHNHLAVVTVYNGDSCGGCFNTIIPQRLVEIASNRKLIICEHCGRIIVNPDFSE